MPSTLCLEMSSTNPQQHVQILPSTKHENMIQPSSVQFYNQDFLSFNSMYLISESSLTEVRNHHWSHPSL